MSSNHLTHLHIHTEYSLLDGAIHLKDLVKLAKEQEWKAIGISDHGNIFGAVKFFQLAQKEKVKPILGIEMYFTPDVAIKNAKEKYFHLILIVQNKVGYKNLCKLISYAYQEGFYFKPRIDYAILAKHSEGLIASTACLGGHIPTLLQEDRHDEAVQRIHQFQEIFGPNRFFFELQPTDQAKQITLNNLLFDYSARYNVPCIATSDAHYLRKEDHQAHETLLSVQTKDVISNPNRFSFGDCRTYVRSTSEMLEIFKGHEDAVWNTGKIADSCDFDFEWGKLFFPQSPVPKDYTQESYFEYSCREGLVELKQKGLIPKEQYPVYDSRLEEEISLIMKMGFIGYFLVVSDFIKWAKEQKIPVGPGRGSAAGSLVAWAMKITNVDPLKYNLLFERFLNPERVSMPDIDIDFCIEGREAVINHVKEKYGHDCVCQIITFGTMMAKSVIKDVARVMEFPFQDANALTDLIPNQLNITLTQAFELEPRLKEMVDSDPKIKHLFDICFKLEGLTRHASKHAAGIVISPEPLDEVLPLYIPSKSTDLVAQYAMTELESIGFLKMDFLGLKNLTVIDRTLQVIKKNYGIEIDLDTLALDDKAVFELISRGQTNAIFQFESDGLKEVLRKLKPSKFEDLIAVNALYRPGPLGAGMVDDFIERRHGRQDVTYMFPELEPILQETYGVIVYQEQVMKISSAIAGYSLGASDILRRAMGKKKADVMAEQRSLFVHGAKENKFDEKKAGELFDLMAYFAGYGFNKSHSTAYALIAYHTAYLKAHYPKEFMAACVSFETSNPDQLTHYLQEISDLGIKTIPPDINRSEMEFTATPDGILFGLQGIKNVGENALKDILAEREKSPFKDMLDMGKRVDLRTVNKRVFESLIYAGALDCLPGNRAQKIAELEKVLARAHELKEQELTGQMDLFGFANDKNKIEEFYCFQPLTDFTTKEKLEKEKEVAGFYLSSHPLRSYSTIQWLTTTSFKEALLMIESVTSLREPTVVCVGLLQSHRVINTKKGDKMAFANMEDLSDHAEIIIFPKTYNQVEQLLDEHDVFLIKGTIDITSQNKCKIKANVMIPIEMIFEQAQAIQSVTLALPATVDKELIENVQSLLKPGSTPFMIAFNERDTDLLLQSKQQIACTPEILQNIEKHGIKISIAV